jgi:hypothetical protein
VPAAPPASGTPTGTVPFSDGATTLSTVSLNDRGQALFGTSTLDLGSHDITAVYNGNSTFTGSAAGITQTIQGGSLVTLGSSASEAAQGQAVTFTATVGAVAPASGTPTGTISFSVDGSLVGSDTVDGAGAATFTTSTLSVGEHTITAAYSGDSTFASSRGNLEQLIDGTGSAGSSVSLTSSLGTVTYGQAVTLSAAVTAVTPTDGTPTGTVAFLDNGTPLGSSPLDSSGQASNVVTLDAGSHDLTAHYLGDSTFSTSDSSPLPLSVNQAQSSITETTDVNPSVSGQAVTFTATVVAVAPGSGTPTGTVTFTDSGTTLGTVSLDGQGWRHLRCPTCHQATAPRGNDVTIVAAPTVTSLSSNVNPSVYGQPVTFTAAVAAVSPGAGTPTGTVTFEDGNMVLDMVTLVGGQATCTTAVLPAGTEPITAVYAGDADFLGSTSVVQLQQVNADGTTTTMTPSANPSTYGQQVTFTATVQADSPGLGVPWGEVLFTDGAMPLGDVTLVNGQASFTMASLLAGSHTIYAEYGGNSDYIGSAAEQNQTVNQAATSVTLTPGLTPSVFGEAVTFTTTVSAVSPCAGTPTGTVQLQDSGSVVATATLDSSGSATFTTAALSGGVHDLSVAYLGAANFLAGTSSIVSQTVEQAPSTTILTSEINHPIVYGQTVMLAAAVYPASPGAGTSTGTVQFDDGSTVPGTAPLNNGIALFTTRTLPAGVHSLSAVYQGSNNYASSTSNSLSQTVTQAATTTVLTSGGLHHVWSARDVHGLGAAGQPRRRHTRGHGDVRGWSGSAGHVHAEQRRGALHDGAASGGQPHHHGHLPGQ